MSPCSHPQGSRHHQRASVDATGVALTAEYSAPSAGPPPWRVYRLTSRQATVVLAATPGGATRWRF